MSNHNNLEREYRKASIEAILFTMGEAVSEERLLETLSIEKEELDFCIAELQKDYEKENRGIRLTFLEGAWQLCTKKEYYPILIKIAHIPKKQILTDILLETLAIIAYRQPVTKQEIEKIRGVKTDHAVNKLIEYGLIYEVGRLDAPGRPLMFATTEEFLRRFDVDTVDKLPELPPERLADFRTEAWKQAQELYSKEETEE